MEKFNMGFFYGKLYNSCNRTFSVGNGEKFIGGTGPYGDVIKFNVPKHYLRNTVYCWKMKISSGGPKLVFFLNLKHKNNTSLTWMQYYEKTRK